MAGAAVSRLRANPAYSELVSDLREAITAGSLASGDRISGEVALSQEYEISVTSVRRGIEVLVEDGLLTRRQGSGTYVTEQLKARPQRPSPSLQRDTIAMLSTINPLTYHPYYSERLAGLRTGLTQQGWKLWEPELSTEPTDQTADFASVPYGWDLDRLWREVQEHREFAGLVVSSSFLPKEPAWRPTMPLISPDLEPRVPFVAFSWERETETCFRHLLERGCRRIWTLGVFQDDLLQGAARHAAGALGCQVPELVTRQTSNNIRSISVSVRTAYELAQRDLVAEAIPADGILVTSDFEVQGVLDALQDADAADQRPFVAMINKQSRLHLPRHVARLVLDGYQQGETLARVLHEWIVRPASAPHHIILNGNLEIYD